jgi:hypothetical protein
MAAISALFAGGGPAMGCARPADDASRQKPARAMRIDLFIAGN